MALQSMTALASITLQEASASVSFSGIPQNYRDLVVVINGIGSAAGAQLWFNEDLTSSNYRSVVMYNSGDTPTSGVQDTLYFSIYGFESRQASINQIFDYSQTNKHKMTLTRANQAGTNVGAYATRWTNSAAIDSILARMISGTFNPGTTFDLYGRIG